MNNTDLMGVSSDTLAVIFTGLQSDDIFKLICLIATIVSIVAGIALKIISAVRAAKKDGDPRLTEDEKDRLINDLRVELNEAKNKLDKVEGILGSAKKEGA